MKRRRMRYGEESGGTSGFRVLISSVMSRLIIFYLRPLPPPPLSHNRISLTNLLRCNRICIPSDALVKHGCLAP